MTHFEEDPFHETSGDGRSLIESRRSVPDKTTESPTTVENATQLGVRSRIADNLLRIEYPGMALTDQHLDIIRNEVTAAAGQANRVSFRMPNLFSHERDRHRAALAELRAQISPVDQRQEEAA